MKLILEESGLAILGVVLMYASALCSPELGLFTFCLGLGFSTIGIYTLIFTMHKLNVGQKQNAGIVWVWVTFAMLIGVFGICYISVLWPMMLLLDTVEGMYAFVDPITSVISLIRLVITWVGFIVIIGGIIWALVNSMRREDVTYPY